MHRKIVLSFSAGLVAVTAISVLFVFRAEVMRTMGVSTSSAATSKARSTGFYLDIGASASLGTQPNGVPAHNGHRTKKGYSDDLVALEATHGMALTMREIGCPGETVQTMLGQLKNACYTLPNTQLSIAISYLHDHLDEVGVVTIDLGFNNVRPCLTPTVTIPSCVNRGIVAVRNDLPAIVSRLQRAAGPLVHFVGVGYGDPYLAYYLKGSSGRVVAQQGLVAMNQLNTVLQQVYNAKSVPMANVWTALQSSQTNLVTTSKFGVVPENVAQACSDTWMCTPPPFGPDDHSNNAGYSIIAHAISAKLPRLS
jgi:hypothetical protein